MSCYWIFSGCKLLFCEVFCCRGLLVLLLNRVLYVGIQGITCVTITGKLFIKA